jgi:Flp pilus assembly pilin Flp
MLKIPPEKEELVAKALEYAWLLGLGALMVLIGFVLLLMKFSPGPLGN